MSPTKTNVDDTAEDIFNVNGGRRRFDSSDDRHFDIASMKIVTSKDIGYSERIGAKMDQWLQKSFAAWGRMCAGHPVAVLCVGLAASCALAAGLVLFQVTTDPVELWSAANSRARQERNYFNDHFT